MTSDLSEDVTAGLGRRLLRRAASPGLIRPDLATRIQRRSFAGGAGLATEIQRRWLPGGPADWGYGSGLPYVGFGGPPLAPSPWGIGADFEELGAASRGVLTPRPPLPSPNPPTPGEGAPPPKTLNLKRAGVPPLPAGGWEGDGRGGRGVRTPRDVAPIATKSASAGQGSEGLVQRKIAVEIAPRGPATAVLPPAEPPAAATAAGGLDLDDVLEDVVERVMRRLTRFMAVESERHGGRRWP